MVRYELAKSAEKYVYKLAEKVNRDLEGAELCQLKDHGGKRAVFIIRDPFCVDRKDYFNGFVSVYINFDKKKPEFLNNEDYNPWYKKIKEIAEKRFGIYQKFNFKGDPDYAPIDFEEPSEKELYALTENKKETFQKGFDRIKKYIKWYCSAVKNYDEVVKSHSKKMNKYLTGLENLVLA